MIWLSLCIPTNGISEWVIPVLDRVYEQKVDHSQFEVIVTDNGSNKEFYSVMQKYVSRCDNLIYKKTDAFLFENQIEALRMAHGEYLKFMNHRSMLEEGALEWLIELIKEYQVDKPGIYLSDGQLDLKKRMEYSTFNEFVAGLKRYASWTTGVGVWKTDFEKMPHDWIYNRISPHSDVLFHERNKGKYVIDDRKWCHEIDYSAAKKGKYDIYQAFAIEEITITLGLYIDGDISVDTLRSVIKDYKMCVAEFYWNYNIRRKRCSYILDGFNDSMGVFMKKSEVLIRAYFCVPVIAFWRLYIKKLFV